MFWKYNWQCNFRLIFFCSCGKMSHESFESMTPTHPMRSYFARRPSMNVPEETFFLAARRAPGCSVLYRWIVLSARGSYKVSVDCTFASLMTSPVRKYRYLNYLILPIFTWWHLCEKTCGWKLYAFKSIRDDRLNDICKIARLNWATTISVKFINNNYFNKFKNKYFCINYIIFSKDLLPRKECFWNTILSIGIKN